MKFEALSGKRSYGIKKGAKAAVITAMMLAPFAKDVLAQDKNTNPGYSANSGEIKPIDFEYSALLDSTEAYGKKLKLEENPLSIKGLELALSQANIKFTFPEYKKWADLAKENGWTTAHLAFERFRQPVGVTSQPSGLHRVPERIPKNKYTNLETSGNTGVKKVELKKPFPRNKKK